jgi:hypothetical protein
MKQGATDFLDRIAAATPGQGAIDIQNITIPLGKADIMAAKLLLWLIDLLGNPSFEDMTHVLVAALHWNAVMMNVASAAPNPPPDQEPNTRRRPPGQLPPGIRPPSVN